MPKLGGEGLSADYRIFETAQFACDLLQDFGGRRGWIHRKLAAYVSPQLRRHPHAGLNIKKVRGVQPDTWRYRIGDYRFFYTIDDRQKLVMMLAVDVRGRAY